MQQACERQIDRCHLVQRDWLVQAAQGAQVFFRKRQWDGGAQLGPRWERYGATPEGLVEAGNVFTLELGIQTEAGYVGLEEDVLVTEDGCVFLSPFQRQLMVI